MQKKGVDKEGMSFRQSSWPWEQPQPYFHQDGQQEGRCDCEVLQMTLDQDVSSALKRTNYRREKLEDTGDQSNAGLNSTWVHRHAQENHQLCCGGGGWRGRSWWQNHQLIGPMVTCSGVRHNCSQGGQRGDGHAATPCHIGHTRLY